MSYHLYLDKFLSFQNMFYELMNAHKSLNNQSVESVVYEYTDDIFHPNEMYLLLTIIHNFNTCLYTKFCICSTLWCHYTRIQLSYTESFLVIVDLHLGAITNHLYLRFPKHHLFCYFCE